MAAAVLGHAARRLGGGALRQTHEAVVSRLSPAVELGQRRLSPSPRFTHTEVEVHQRCTCGKPEKDGELKRIQGKKEELFDLMAEAHKKYGKDTDKACRKNKTLLQDLSYHVKDRSGDPVWEWANDAKGTDALLNVAGTVALHTGGVYLYIKTLFWVFQKLD